MTGRPTAAPPYFPYKHDSMAVVMAREGLLWNCGHERTPENTANTGNGRCRLCWNAYCRERYGRTRYERERRSANG